MPNFAGNQSSASGSAVDRPHLRSSSSPSLLSESSESDDRGVTGLGVRGVASQSLPSVRQLSGAAAAGVFAGDAVCSGGTGGGLTVFVDVGAGASTGVFAGLVLLGRVRFVGLLWRSASRGHPVLAAWRPSSPGSAMNQPMLGGFGAAGKWLGSLPPRVRQRGLVWSGTSVLWSVARRSYAVRNTKAGN